MTSEHEGCGNHVVVVDRLPLRRAQLLHFLELWAESRALTVSERPLSDIAMIARPERICLFVFGIGTDDLSGGEMSSALRIAHAVSPAAPCVVFAEGVSTSVVERALRLGVAGLIPATLRAETANAALSFILAGGSYFPSESLLARAPDPRDPSHRDVESDGPDPVRERSLAASAAPASLPVPPGSNAAHGVWPASQNEQDPPSGLGASRPSGTSHRPRDAIGSSVGVDAECDDSRGQTLTARQEEVLECISRGLSNKHIARELDMSEATVKAHIRHIMKRLGVTNRTQVAVFAIQQISARREMSAIPSRHPGRTRTP